MRKRGLSIAGLVLLFLVLGLGFQLNRHERMRAAHEAETARLMESAAHYHQTFSALGVVEGRGMVLAMGAALPKTVLSHLKGLEIISSRGHRLLLEEVRIHLEPGYLKLESDAYFQSFFYKGPVSASWLGLAHLDGDGRCRLDFRTVHISPRGAGRENRWLNTWLLLRGQQKLKFPSLALPGVLQRNLALPVQQRQVAGGLTLTVPSVDLDLTLARPGVVVGPEGIWAVADGLQLDGEAPAVSGEVPVFSAGVDLALAVPITLLDRVLEVVVARDQDMILSAEVIPGVWRQEKKVLGLRVRNHADLEDIRGHLDVIGADLIQDGDQWWLDLRLEGRITGFLRGKAYGISLEKAFVAEPNLAEKIPITLVEKDAGPMLTFPEHPLTLDVTVETEVAGRSVSFTYPMSSSSGELLRPVELAGLLQSEVEIPTRVREGKVLDSRRAVLAMRWTANVPTRNDGYLVLEGTLAGIDLLGE